MLLLLSPAKKQRIQPPALSLPATTPRLLAQTDVLHQHLHTMNVERLGRLLGVSTNLADLNHVRFQNYDRQFFDAQHATQALFAYRGDAYQALNADHLSAEDCHYADPHIRIISAYYGLLRPLDAIQPYRLEMTTPSFLSDYRNLKSYWQNAITDLLIADARATGSEIILNCASQAYADAVNRDRLTNAGLRMVDCLFQETQGAQYRTVGILAKKGRGLMARHAIVKRSLGQDGDASDRCPDHDTAAAEGVRAFAHDGYRLNEDCSTRDRWVFTRPAAMPAH